jgi:tankyrase
LEVLFLFAAGYNNLEVAEFLLDHGADVNAQDKGGLIPLHNASSYGHLDIAALLIKFNTVVNAVDKWGFTPLHEAAQKGRTQLCALLVSCVWSMVLINLCRKILRGLLLGFYI